MALGYQKHLSLRTLKKAIILVYRNSLQLLSVKIGRETKIHHWWFTMEIYILKSTAVEYYCYQQNSSYSCVSSQVIVNGCRQLIVCICM